MDEYRPVWAEIDLDGRPRQRANAARGRGARRAVRGREGGRLRARRGSRRARGASTPARRASRSRSSKKASSCATPESTRRSSCSRNRFPTPRRSVVAHRLTPVVYTLGRNRRARPRRSRPVARDAPLGVHLKVDTGMHRVGCTPADAVALATHIVNNRPELALAGVCTHFAVADEPENPYTAEQARAFEAVLAELRARAACRRGSCTRATPRARSPHHGAHYDMVRAGIGIYGIAPAPSLAGAVALEPAMSVKARVSYVQTLAAGARVSYGLRYEAERATRRSRPCPPATPTACRASCRIAAAPCLIRWHASSDRGNDHHGPADGRRRRDRGRGRRRGRAHRPAGRRRDHGRRSGPTGWTRSRTPSCAASARASRGGIVS